MAWTWSEEMFAFFNNFRGSIRVSATGAHPETLLNECLHSGVELISAQRTDDVTLQLRVPYRQRRRLEQAAQRSQCQMMEMGAVGTAALRRLMWRRIGLALGLLLLSGLLLWSKLYIWNIEVKGNERVSEGKILAALEECGVGIGSYWPAFTSDLIRSEALLKLPELRWLTVNIYGSRAEVIVRERVEKPEMHDDSLPADLVAEKDGFIMELRVLKGKVQVRRGQAVSAGECLISGAVPDLRGNVRTVYALGEVIARTYYEESAWMPLSMEEKQYTGEQKSSWALFLGKKRINFYGNSSIYEEDCDKIYSVYQLSLPGLFSLPIRVQRETRRYYERSCAACDANLGRQMLEEQLHRRLRRETEGGEIIAEHFSCTVSDGRLIVCLRAECQENIAQTRPMEEARLREARNTPLKEEQS